MCIFKKIIKEIPGTHIVWCLQPDIWSIYATGYRISSLFKSVIDRMGISHIICNLFFQLCFSFWGINSFTCALYDVWCTIKFCSMTSCPQIMQCNAFSYQIFRNDRKSKANTCKSGIFGKAAQFDRTGACTFTLINTVRNIFFCNICFISGIVNDHRTIFICIIYPFLQFIFCDCCTTWIIRKTEIDQIRCLYRQFRKKSI